MPPTQIHSPFSLLPLPPSIPPKVLIFSVNTNVFLARSSGTCISYSSGIFEVSYDEAPCLRLLVLLPAFGLAFDSFLTAVLKSISFSGGDDVDDEEEEVSGRRRESFGGFVLVIRLEKREPRWIPESLSHMRSSCSEIRARYNASTALTRQYV